MAFGWDGAALVTLARDALHSVRVWVRVCRKQRPRRAAWQCLPPWPARPCEVLLRAPAGRNLKKEGERVGERERNRDEEKEGGRDSLLVPLEGEGRGSRVAFQWT